MNFEEFKQSVNNIVFFVIQGANIQNYTQFYDGYSASIILKNNKRIAISYNTISNIWNTNQLDAVYSGRDFSLIPNFIAERYTNGRIY